MITKESLKSFYESELQEKLSGLEGLRKRVRNNQLWIALLFLLPVGLFALLLFLFNEKEPDPYWFLILLPPIIAAFILIFINSKKKKVFKNRYKNEVVSEIVRAINPEWQYEPGQCITTSEYYQSQLFQHPYDRYAGDDLISGTIEKTDFRCSELHTEYKTVTHDKDGKRHETWHTIFRGLFFHADFNKHIQGNTFVEPDTAERLFGKFGQKLQASTKGRLVKLENPEFEKLFVVFSTDQTEARYILTPAIMESMVNIYKRYKRNMHVSFIGTRMYVALSFNQALYEPKIWRSLVSFKDVEIMYDLMMVNETIIREMNLNTRIWTKE